MNHLFCYFGTRVGKRAEIRRTLHDAADQQHILVQVRKRNFVIHLFAYLVYIKQSGIAHGIFGNQFAEGLEIAFRFLFVLTFRTCARLSKGCGESQTKGQKPHQQQL